MLSESEPQITYDTVYKAFEWERPSHYNFAVDVIDAWARREPNKTAMIWTNDEGDVVQKTFSDFSHSSKKCANVLKNAGVNQGDAVIIILSRQIVWWDILTATLRMGAVASPGTIQLAPKDIKYRVDAANARCIVTDVANADKVDAIAHEIPLSTIKILIDGEREGWISLSTALETAGSEYPNVKTAVDDDALCYFTSGTTGYPKMTVHGHGYALGHETTGRFWLDFRDTDLHWNISDTGWAKAAWSSYFAPWKIGAALFVFHTSGFNPAETLNMFQKFPISTMCGAPTIYRMFVQQDLESYAFPHLRHCVAAGEPLNPEVISIWKKATGITVKDGYGQTETTILCGNMLGLPVKAGSMGKPAPGVHLDIIDNEANPIGPNVEGDIAVKIIPHPPQGLFKRYKDDPERTAATKKGDYYITGDRAYRDEDGYFWFVSRSDDVIISAGYRIGPFEVESALIEHPSVAESAVVGASDPTRGQVVKAYIVLADGYDPSDNLKKDLQNYVKAVTAPYKYPRQIKFVDDLPKTVSGKIRRIELREESQ